LLFVSACLLCRKAYRKCNPKKEEERKAMKLRRFLQVLLCTVLLLPCVPVLANEEETLLNEEESQEEIIEQESVIVLLDNSSISAAVFDQEKAFAMALINELSLQMPQSQFALVCAGNSEEESLMSDVSQEEQTQEEAQFQEDNALLISAISTLDLEQSQDLEFAFAKVNALCASTQGSVKIIYLGSSLYTSQMPVLAGNAMLYGFLFREGMEEDALLYSHTLLANITQDSYINELSSSADMYAHLEESAAAIASGQPLTEQEQEISAQPEEPAQEEQPQVESRYTVLVLDVSGSMQGDPLSTLKSSVSSFCRTLLEDEVADQIALVTFDTKASVICSFTSDLQALQTAIANVQVGNLTNLSAGLLQAQSLLEQIPAQEGIYKNVVICTDGLPGCGQQQEEGLFSAADGAEYAYTNAALSLDSVLKNEACVYTIGSFGALSSDETMFARTFMQEMATDNQYYQASASYFLQLAFEQIAAGITSNQHLNAGSAYPVSLQVQLEKESMCVGQSQQLMAWFMPDQSGSFSYASSDESIASVDENGCISANKPGTVTISIRSENGLSASVSVTIYGKYDIRRLFGWL
jgi:Mg-chelatase subunit ChlD